MLTGRLVGLRPIRADDLDFLADLANEPGVRRNVVGWSWPVARDAQRDWLQRSQHDPQLCRLTVTDNATNRPVGLTGLWDVDWHNRAALTAIKLMPGAAPKGAGSDAIMLTMAWSFYEVGLHRLYSDILPFNGPSLGMIIRRCGWKVEGRTRESCFRHGAWHDQVIVGVLRSDFDAHPDAREYIERICGQPMESPLRPELEELLEQAVGDHRGRPAEFPNTQPMRS